LTCVGFEPALKTSYFSPYRCFSKASAICDLAELCSHRKRIFVLFIYNHLFAFPSACLLLSRYGHMYLRKLEPTYRVFRCML
jgi:hypothetical protein